MSRRPRIEIDRIPASHLEALGRVTAHAALLDAVVEQLIWRLKKIEPPEGLLHTGEIRVARRRLTMLTSTAKETASEKRVSALIERIKESADDRNALVHARWTGQRKGARSLIASWNRKTFKLEGELRSAREINEIAETIAHLTIETRRIIASL